MSEMQISKAEDDMKMLGTSISDSEKAISDGKESIDTFTDAIAALTAGFRRLPMCGGLANVVSVLYGFLICVSIEDASSLPRAFGACLRVQEKLNVCCLSRCVRYNHLFSFHFN